MRIQKRLRVVERSELFRKRQQLQWLCTERDEMERGEEGRGMGRGGVKRDNGKQVKTEKGRESVNAQEFSQSVRCRKAIRENKARKEGRIRWTWPTDTDLASILQLMVWRAETQGKYSLKVTWEPDETVGSVGNLCLHHPPSSVTDAGSAQWESGGLPGPLWRKRSNTIWRIEKRMFCVYIIMSTAATKMYYRKRKTIIGPLCKHLDRDLVLSGSSHSHHPMRCSIHARGQTEMPIPCPGAPVLTKLRPSGSDDKVRGPQDHPCVWGLTWQTPEDSAHSHPHGYDLLQQNKISKGEKEYGAKFEGNQAQALEGPFPLESRRMHLIVQRRVVIIHVKCHPPRELTCA